jgi:hypothetical protein
VRRHTDSELVGTSHGFGFDVDAVASDGTHVWVANAPLTGKGWVTELNAATGALVKVLKGPSYAFNHPTGIALDGTHAWVANGQPAKQERKGGHSHADEWLWRVPRRRQGS